MRRALLLAGVLAAGLAAVPVQAASPAGAEARGAYLAEIMDCTGCHTGGALMGKADPERFLGGSEIGFEIPGLGVFYPPNLTPDPETGLGTWTKEQIVTAVRAGKRPDGRELVPVMPWRSYAALSDEDALALAHYLKSLKPVRFAAPTPVASQQASAPYLTVVMPR